MTTAARVLIELGDGSGIATADHFVAYAGIALVTRRSGSTIRCGVLDAILTNKTVYQEPVNAAS